MKKNKLNQLLLEKQIDDQEKNCEGVRVDNLEKFVVSDNENICTRNQNDAKRVMDEATRNLIEAESRVLKASGSLKTTINDMIPETKKRVSIAKDQANQMADFLGKLNRMLGDDFDKRLHQLKEMTACLETLERIQSNPAMKGVVSEIFKHK